MIYGGRAYRSLNDLEEVVNETILKMKRRIDEFDSIVVRGVSGVVVGAPVAIALHKPLVVIRKPDEQSHDGASVVINRRNLGRWSVFLDDFRSTGDTEYVVRKAIELEAGKIGGCFFYHDGSRNKKGWNHPLVKRTREEAPTASGAPLTVGQMIVIRYRNRTAVACVIQETKRYIQVSYCPDRAEREIWLRRDSDRIVSV